MTKPQNTVFISSLLESLDAIIASQETLTGVLEELQREMEDINHLLEEYLEQK